MFVPTALFIVGTVVQSGVAPPRQTALAKTPLDVIQTTVGSFCAVGGFGFAVTAVQESMKRASVVGRARTQVPYFVVRASLLQAQRWGRVSAGFAGGRALGQALRGVDDSTCAMMGSIAGGIAAAPNLAAVPSSVATFAAFGYFIESLSASKSTAPPSSEQEARQQLANARVQRAKLQRQMDACDREINRLHAQAT